MSRGIAAWFLSPLRRRYRSGTDSTGSIVAPDAGRIAEMGVNQDGAGSGHFDEDSDLDSGA